MALDGDKVTLGAQKDYVQTVNNDILAGFSSWGPVKVNYRVKPDVVAPGVNVLSSVPMHLCTDEAWGKDDGCWAFFQGTSMATPHLAGMAAVVLDAHPEWEAWEVRSAIANTADIDGVLQTNKITVPETDVQKVGNGLADLDAAVTADVAFDRTTLTYGSVAVGSGKTLTTTVSVTDLTGTGGTFPVSVVDSTGKGTFSASPSTVTLTAGQTKAITVTFQVDKGSVGATQAHLNVGDSHLALYAFLK
jgi:subtilisin family serine protease